MRQAAGQKSVDIVVNGSVAESNKLGIGSSEIDPGGPTPEQTAYSMTGFGSSDVYDRQLVAPKPIGSYIHSAAVAALASRGLSESPGAPVKLTVVVDRFEYDMLNSGDRTRKAWIEASVFVNDNEGRTRYSRKVAVESSVERGNVSAAVDVGGAVMAGVVGVGISGEGLRRNEEVDALNAAVAGAFSKFEDEVAGDPDLIAALSE